MKSKNTCRFKFAFGKVASLPVFILFIISIPLVFASCVFKKELSHDNGLPKYLIGDFMDDYGNTYSVNNEIFILRPTDKYNILIVNRDENYLIAQNDSLNAFAPLKYSRIDFVKLRGMSPYKWAFCFSAYQELSLQAAIKKDACNSADLMEGCNGFPFSRMKPFNETNK